MKGSINLTLLAAILCLALTGIGRAGTGAGTTNCASRAVTSGADLASCIERNSLWNHLSNFQLIAEQNPGPDGHPSRNAGEPGYLASVNYVAGLMERAGYSVSVQPFTIPYFAVSGTPRFAEASPHPQQFAITTDWYVAYYSGSGSVSAPVQAAGGIVVPSNGQSASGCNAGDFVGFAPGNVALVQLGGCSIITQMGNAKTAGASAVIVFNQGGSASAMAPADVFLSRVAPFPVITASYAVGAELYGQLTGGGAPVLQLAVNTIYDPHRADYNLIAESPYGDPDHVVILDAHLDAIFGAGILDNASGSATILETALNLAGTPTRNKLRFIWFGGEEVGLLGSAFYAQSLSPAELSRIVFDVDADVTGSPNYNFMIADPAYASNASSFPANVAPASQVGNQYFSQYFTSLGLTAYDGPLGGGNNGTDSNSLSQVGIPNTGIFTGQDCCKTQGSVNIWGGYLGNHEGNIPSFDGGCVDYAGRWCDNLSNVDLNIIQIVTQAFAYVTFQLANDPLPNTLVPVPAKTRVPAPRRQGGAF